LRRRCRHRHRLTVRFGSSTQLDEHGNAKIADLGVSRITTETATMTCVGSAQWTAPEILRHQPYDQAVDVYSYGIVLWELLSGRQPYAHLSRLEAAVAVASTQLRPEIPDHWPARWVQLMQSCWHESPQVRPTFAQVVDRIESF
jgi:serine/threonine-protein kinase TNNI3K